MGTAALEDPQDLPSGQGRPTRIRQTTNISDHGPVLSTVPMQDTIPDTRPGHFLTQGLQSASENVTYEEEPPWFLTSPSYPEAPTRAIVQNNFSWFV